MATIRRSEEKVLSEAYTQVLNTEGFFDRVAATGAGVMQTAKNVGSGIKATGQALTGNLAGAQATVAKMSPADDAKMQSILKNSAKNFLTDIFKLKLIPGAENLQPQDVDIKAFITAVEPFLQQLKASKAPAPAAPATGTTPATPAAPATPPVA